MSSKIQLVYLMRRMVGGMQTHLISLVSHLDRSRYQVTVVSPENPVLAASLAELGIPMVVVDIDDRLNPIADSRSVKILREKLRELRPDILHIHGNKTALVGRLAARKMGIPAVIVTVHNFLIFQERGAALRLPAAWMERWLAGYTDRIIAVSSSLADSLVEIEGLPGNKIVVIPNGIDVAGREDISGGASLRRRLGIGENNLLAVNIGRLVPFKGHKVLLRAAAIISQKDPRIKVAIAGDGPLMESLKKQMNDSGLGDSIHFLGFLPGCGELLAAADLFVLPSIKEPFGIVILEAMAAGVPVIATRAGGVPEIISNDCGLLVEPGDAEALAAAILELAGDKARRDRLAEAARNRLYAEFTVEKMTERTAEVYRQCLKENGDRPE